jgi:hypothetical protein
MEKISRSECKVTIDVRAKEKSKQDVYVEVTRRLSQAKREEIENRIESLQAQEVRTTALLTAFNARDMKAVAEDAESFYIGLALLKLGKITQHQFGTLQKYWQARETYGDRLGCIPLFAENHELNPLAKHLIASTLRQNVPKSRFGGLPHYMSDSLLSDAQLEQLFEEMRAQPGSEQQFFIFPDDDPYEVAKILEAQGKKDNGASYHDSHSISHEILYSAGLNLFARFRRGDAFYRMIPSSELVQTFLNVSGEDNAVYLNHVLGDSTVEGDIRDNGLNSSRDVQIAGPGIPTPRRADGFPALGYDFAYHDECYHAVLCSQMPAEARSLMVQAGDTVGDLAATSDANERAAFIALRDRFYDMENSLYWPRYQGGRDKNGLFWESLAGQFEIVRDQSHKPHLSLDAERRIMAALVKELPEAHETIQAGPCGVASRLLSSHQKLLHDISVAHEEQLQAIVGRLGPDPTNGQRPEEGLRDYVRRRLKEDFHSRPIVMLADAFDPHWEAALGKEEFHQPTLRLADFSEGRWASDSEGESESFQSDSSDDYSD